LLASFGKDLNTKALITTNEDQLDSNMKQNYAANAQNTLAEEQVSERDVGLDVNDEVDLYKLEEIIAFLFD
jgi:hypothetical protein